MAMPPVIPAGSSPPPKRRWMGIVLLLAGIAVIAVGFFLSLMFLLKEMDQPSTGTPNALFIGGSVIGGGLALAGIVLLVVNRRRSHRQPR